MLRWLVVAVLLVLLGAVAEARLRRLLGGGGDRSRRPGSRAPRSVRQAELVPCAACGLHVERTRAVRGTGGLHFCSPACAERVS